MERALENLKMNLITRKKVEEALAEQKKRLDEEHARILQIIDSDERESEMLKLKITNEILTLRCPNCKMAFVDFDGIMCALTLFYLTR